MGGPGSGSWYRWNKKETTESQRRIDIRWMKKQGYLQPGYTGALSWTCNGEESGRINFKTENIRLILSYRYRLRGEDWQDVDQEILFDKTRCNYGGYRQWFLCTRCSRRVAILYGAGKYFHCRHCCNLTYDTQNSSWLQRIFDRANKLKKKLGGEPGLAYPVPRKPKGMHWKTYDRIKAEIHRLEEFGEVQMEAKYGQWY